jgi:hypothetical protein
MNLPNIPTDNLYKFLALSGIAMLLLFTYYLGSESLELDRQNISLSGEIAQLDLEAGTLKQEQRALRSEIEDFYNAAGLKEPLVVNDSMVVYSQIASGPPQLVKKSKELQHLVDEFAQKGRDHQSKRIALETKRSIQKYNEDVHAQLFSIYAVTFSIAFLLSVSGFWLWYSRVQRYHNAILHEQYILAVSAEPRCQSCGILLSDDPESGGTETNGMKSVEFCSSCYEKGKFREPDLELHQMISKVNKRMKSLEVPLTVRASHIFRLSKLKRWDRRLRW